MKRGLAPFISAVTIRYVYRNPSRGSFFQLPVSEQAVLLDDLIVGSCEAVWEARLGSEMEERIDAVERGEMPLYEAADVFDEMRARLRS